MKTTLKLTTFLVALASTFTFSSCLNDNESGNYPTYSSYVTIAGDNTFGYTFYSDFGATLRPTAASVQQVLPGLNSSVRRAYIAFDLASESENGKDLEAGTIYDIILCPSYYANFAIPTYRTIPLTEASDSLITNNERIQEINKSIWAINGYVNAQMTISYQQNQPFYINTYYDRENDIVPETNTLYLNLYYNSKSKSHSGQGSSVFSFDLPEEVVNSFSSDSINLVLRAITGYDDQTLTEVGSCTVAKKDFYVPTF